MDKTTLEEINKGKRNFLILVGSILLIIGIIAGLFTDYKEETLVCRKKDDICYVERTNFLNSKKKQEIIKISNIKYVTFNPKTVAGNMYASGYTAYYLAFMSKQKELINVFSTEYYEKEEVERIVANIQAQLKDSSVEEIKLTQKL